MKKLILILSISIVIIYGCSKSDPITYDCTGLTPKYTTDVKPLMDANCVSCHSYYSTYSSLKTRATEKAFMGSMQQLSGYDAMPKGKSKLTETQLKTISCWIANGMPE